MECYNGWVQNVLDAGGKSSHYRIYTYTGGWMAQLSTLMRKKVYDMGHDGNDIDPFIRVVGLLGCVYMPFNISSMPSTLGLMPLYCLLGPEEWHMLVGAVCPWPPVTSHLGLSAHCHRAPTCGRAACLLHRHQHLLPSLYVPRRRVRHAHRIAADAELRRLYTRMYS